MGLLGSLLSGLAMAGCSSELRLPNVTYLSLGMNVDQVIDASSIQEIQTRLNGLEMGYRQIHPASRFQFSVYPENQLAQTIGHRNQAGLGPDLLFVNGSTAVKLLSQGVVDPFPATARDLQQFTPGDLNRIRDNRGRLAGLPVLVETQVACFNRRKLPQAPATMQELLVAGASGHPVGLSADVINLFWTAGSLGAVDSITKLMKNQPIDQQDLEGLIRWMVWLQNANNQLRVTFYPNQQTVMEEFLAGRLDWIPCNSITLPRLREKLGSSLGVSALPRGEAGPASPVNRLRVLALGSSSSRGGRDRALAFARFGTNPLTQRMVTLGSQTVLPANRFVRVPEQSSEVLHAMASAKQTGQAIDSTLESLVENDPRLGKVQSLITQLLFGESSPQGAAEQLVSLFRRPR